MSCKVSPTKGSPSVPGGRRKRRQRDRRWRKRRTAEMIRRKSTGVKMKDAISKKEWLVLCVYTNVMLCCMEYYIEGGREGD